MAMTSRAWRHGAGLPHLRLQAAGQQELFDQGVQLAQVVLDFLAQALAHGRVGRVGGVGVLQQAQRHLQARQRRAQFV